MTKNLLESCRNKGFEHCIRAPLVLAVRRSNLADCLQKCLQCNVCKSICIKFFFVWSIALKLFSEFLLPSLCQQSIFPCCIDWGRVCFNCMEPCWINLSLKYPPITCTPHIPDPSIGAGPHILHTTYLCFTTTYLVVSSGQLVTSLAIPQIPSNTPNTCLLPAVVGARSSPKAAESLRAGAELNSAPPWSISKMTIRVVIVLVITWNLMLLVPSVHWCYWCNSSFDRETFIS